MALKLLCGFSCLNQENLRGLNKSMFMVYFRIQRSIWSLDDIIKDPGPFFSLTLPHSEHYLSSPSLSPHDHKMAAKPPDITSKAEEKVAKGTSLTLLSLTRKENCELSLWFHGREEGQTDQICWPTQAEFTSWKSGNAISQMGWCVSV